MNRISLGRDFTTATSVEASTVGFAPGVWPTRFMFGDFEFLRKEFKRRPGGELECVLYEQRSNGRILTVFND